MLFKFLGGALVLLANIHSGSSEASITGADSNNSAAVEELLQEDEPVHNCSSIVGDLSKEEAELLRNATTLYGSSTVTVTDKLNSYFLYPFNWHDKDGRPIVYSMGNSYDILKLFIYTDYQRGVQERTVDLQKITDYMIAWRTADEEYKELTVSAITLSLKTINKLFKELERVGGAAAAEMAQKNFRSLIVANSSYEKRDRYGKLRLELVKCYIDVISPAEKNHPIPVHLLLSLLHDDHC